MREEDLPSLNGTENHNISGRYFHYLCVFIVDSVDIRSR